MREAHGGQRMADCEALETGDGKRMAEREALETGDGRRDAAGDAARLQEAIAIAYRYVNRRERTRAEVQAHLERAGVDARSIEEAIETLADYGQLDDLRFARLFIQDKRELEGWGTDRIRRVLLARGADPDLIEGALTEAGANDEMERALELLRRRFPSPPQERRDRDRALGVLLRKGYDPDLALEALAAHTRAADA